MMIYYVKYFMLKNLSLAKIYLEHDIQDEYFMTQGNEKGINFAFN